MKSLSDRFILFLRGRGINQKDFCETTGYGIQSLSKFCKGNTPNPGINLSMLLLKHFPEFNQRWWYFEEGSMWNEGYGYGEEEDKAKPVSTKGIGILGSGAEVQLMQELLSTKDMLIQSQQKQITVLERDNERLRG